jgi:hypothetical protein
LKGKLRIVVTRIVYKTDCAGKAIESVFRLAAVDEIGGNKEGLADLPIGNAPSTTEMVSAGPGGEGRAERKEQEHRPIAHKSHRKNGRPSFVRVINFYAGRRK